MVERIDRTYSIMVATMFYQETNTCLVESIVNRYSFSKPQWYVFIMITNLGKKRWEALPLHVTEDRWYIHITVNYGSYPVADLGGGKGGANVPPIWLLVMYFCIHNCRSPYSSGMQQQQPGTVTHSCISYLLISRHLTRPRVASRYSVGTFT